MEVEVRTIFKCEFCGKEFTDKIQCEEHEEVCANNPINKPCSKCSNCEVDLIHGVSHCTKNIDMTVVDDVNVLCFGYEEGTPLPSIASIGQLFQDYMNANSVPTEDKKDDE